MLYVRQFCDLIVLPALEAIHLYSQAAEQLLLGTALQESGLRYLQQLGEGPAVGLFQMEPATHDDIWTHFLAYQPELAERVAALGIVLEPSTMVGNLWYAAAMARIHYLRVPAPLPDYGDIEGQAAYWKRYYNTPLGAGTVDEYLENWHRHAAGFNA